MRDTTIMFFVALVRSTALALLTSGSLSHLAFGEATFRKHIVIQSDANAPAFVWGGDLDGDADVDILFASELDDRIGWYENEDGQFAHVQIITEDARHARAVCVADIDGDGDADVVSGACGDEGVAWYENNGKGEFGPARPVRPGEKPAMYVQAGDVDRDGDVDLVATSEDDGSLCWYANDGEGGFAPPRNIAVRPREDGWRGKNAAARPRPKLIDIDGDGDLDVLATFAAGHPASGIYSYDNEDGRGSFSDRRLLARFDLYLDTFEAADVDGDGDTDLAGSMRFLSQGRVAWYENDSGKFSKGKTIPSPHRSFSLCSGDIDADGDLDIATVGTGFISSDGIFWMENVDGTGLFARLHRVSREVRGRGVALTIDLDRDGDLDIVSASDDDDKIAWYENTDGRGKFGSQIVLSAAAAGARSVAAADLDLDGDLDIVSASQIDGRIALYENMDGKGQFSRQKIIKDATSGATTVSTGDLDGDGDPDVMSTSEEDGVAWYQNLGDLRFGEQKVIARTFQPNSVIPVDLDADGDLDVLYATRDAYKSVEDRLAWRKNLDGRGHFGDERIIAKGDSMCCAYAADIDGDGDMDPLAAFGGGTVAWFPNTKGAFGSARVVTSDARSAYSLHVADIDSDGRLDIVLASGSARFSWYRNLDRKGVFGPQQVLSEGQGGGASVFAGDLDGDGDLDVVSASFCSGGDVVAWHQNLDGHGKFGPKQIITTEAAWPWQVLMADVNGDGDLDILCPSQDDDTIAWYENCAD